MLLSSYPWPKTMDYKYAQEIQSLLFKEKDRFPKFVQIMYYITCKANMPVDFWNCKYPHEITLKPRHINYSVDLICSTETVTAGNTGANLF